MLLMVLCDTLWVAWLLECAPQINLLALLLSQRHCWFQATFIYTALLTLVARCIIERRKWGNRGGGTEDENRMHTTHKVRKWRKVKGIIWLGLCETFIPSYVTCRILSKVKKRRAFYHWIVASKLFILMYSLRTKLTHRRMSASRSSRNKKHFLHLCLFLQGRSMSSVRCWAVGARRFPRGVFYIFLQCHNLLSSSEVLTPIQYLPSPLSPSLTSLVSHHRLTHLLHTGPKH